MTGSRFVHLHLHTAYSLLDGAIRIPDMIASMQKYGMHAAAITDHGNMFGIVDFYTSMKKAQLKPILGCEAYITPGDRRDQTRRLSHHLVLLAENMTGYRNLTRLVSKAYLEGFYYHPRIDYELLEQYHEGLIGLSACLAGEIPSAILDGQYQSALDIAARYSDIFGKGNFYLEVQRNDLEDQDRANKDLLKISRELGLPLVATNDSHYLNKDDKKAHEALLCLQTGKTLDDPDRFTYKSEALYFRSPDEMIPLFDEFPGAIQSTLEIAERCNVTLNLDKPVLPKYQVPEGMTLDSYLHDKALAGLEERFAMIAYPIQTDVYRERLKQELDIIEKMGFSGYFLIVWDFIRYAHENDIPVGPGRGSGAGSLTAYSLRITDLDPMPYNLLFERFLNPERVSMPDFDIDFCMNRRDEVIRYVAEKYGADRVGQIVTFNCMKAKVAIRDVGRVLNVPLSEVDRMAKLVPNDLNITLEEALVKEPRLKEMISRDPRHKEVFEIAQRLEGLNRHVGVHAAGVVISEEPLWETVPVKKGDAGELVTQFAKDEVEKAGLVKFDFLGLKTLTVIHCAEELINQMSKKSESGVFDIKKIPLDDSTVYSLISTGDTFGVFQMEGSGFQDMIRKMQPSCFEDIIAAVALYRPGPMSIIPDFIARKHGQQHIAYPHESLKIALKDTYGLMVYQEQVMQISRIMAGFSLGYADILRRAMGKKKPEEMAKMRKIFIYGDEEKNVSGAIKLKYDEKLAGEVFDLMEKFAGYGFNKSHAAGYALLAYQTAYLKRYYPREFMTALMTCDRDVMEKIVKAISECRRMGIQVLPPDVNTSEFDFTVVGKDIRFGLAAVKNVGGPAVRAIMHSRSIEGQFKTIFDFCERVDLRSVNRRVIESLIKCGAFDCTRAARSQMMAAIDRAIEAGQSHQRDRETGQVSIFDMLGTQEMPSLIESEYPDLPEWTAQERLAHEKEMLGFFVTGHPMLKVKSELDRFVTHESAQLKEAAEIENIVIAGIVSSVKKYLSPKTKEQMAFVTLEDLSGLIEIVIRPAEWNTKRDLLEKDKVVVISGFSSSNETQTRVIAEKIFTVEEARRKFTRGVTIQWKSSPLDIDSLQKLQSVIVSNKGDAQIQLVVEFQEEDMLKSVILDFGSGYRIDPTERCLMDIQNIPEIQSVSFR